MSKFQNIPYNWRKFISYSLVALASSVLTTVLLIVFGSSTVINYSSTGNYDQGMLKLQEVYNIIQEQYIGEADEEAMIDAAAQALVLATGDQWSYYMNAEEYAYYKQITGNSYEGIGVTVDDSQMEKGFLITGVEPEGGAAAAGIQIGDMSPLLCGCHLKGTAGTGGGLFKQQHDMLPLHGGLADPRPPFGFQIVAQIQQIPDLAGGKVLQGQKTPAFQIHRHGFSPFNR